MSVIDLTGYYDVHVHPGPEPFARIGDTFDFARWCAATGMAGIVAKGHFDSSVTRAHHANRELADQFPNFTVYGAIVLNRGVGGINPSAVEVALEMGARFVWLPTFDAANHSSGIAAAGSGYGFRTGTLNFKSGTKIRSGLKIVDENGALIPEAKEVVDIIAAYEACLATGHVSKEEILAVVDYAESKGLKRIIVTHAQGRVPNLDLPTMIGLAKRGVFMEFCVGEMLPFLRSHTLVEVRESIEAVGADRTVLSSDSGHVIYPRPPETLRSCLQMLHERGLPIATIKKACVDNPRFLLGLS